MFISAKFCFSQDLKVPRLLLENEQNYFLDSLRLIFRRDFSPSLPAAIKVGGWSRRDVTRILQNWVDLQEATGLAERELDSVLDNSNLSPEDWKKKLVLSYWCARGLSSLRDPCEVFQKLRILRVRQSEAVILSNDEAVERVSLLHSQNYKLLADQLQMEDCRTPLKVAARFVLSQNLRVPRLSLENEQNYFTPSLRGILRRNFDKNFHPDMKVGRWSERDKARVSQNLTELEAALAFTPEDVLALLDNSSLSQTERRMKNVVGHWSSRGLSNMRDPCEVFQMLRILRATRGTALYTLTF